MIEGIVGWLLDPAGLTPHGFCLSWQPGLIWTQVLADIVVGAAYFSISLALMLYARRRRDFAFRRLVWMFAAFIVLCGVSHWIDALTVWAPAYGAQSLLKAATAVASAATAVTLWWLLPQAIARPSSTQFRAMSEALRTSEAFLDRIGRLAGVGGWELDLATGAIHWSAETYRIHGVAPDYKPVLEQAIEFYAPEARPVVQAAIARAAAGGEGWDLELPFIRADGRRIWVRAVGTIMFADGKAARAIGAFQDVTDRVAQRLAVQNANERATLATESAGIGVWERDLDSNAMIWDACMFRMYGLEPAAAAPTYAQWRQQVHPDDIAIIESEAHVSRDSARHDAAAFRIIWSDGSLHHIRVFARIVCDLAGRPAKLVGVNIDVTESRLLTAELDRQAVRLAESEAKFRLLAENADDMISWVGPDRVRRYVSPAAAHIFGVPIETLIDGDPLDFVHEDDKASVLALQAELIAGVVKTSTATFRLLNPTRGEVWVEASGRSLRSEQEAPPFGYVSVLRDVTERVHIQHRLRASNAELSRLARHFAKARTVAEQASRAKTQFLASMSHELRTPLNGILGYAQLLRMDGGLTETQATRIDAMLAAGTHLLEMIHCVLDLSQIESGGAEVQASVVELRNLAEACLSLVRPGADAKPLALSLVIDADAPRYLSTDPTRLRQVLLNLLGNAVKFTARGAVMLRLRTAPADAMLRFEVVDTGPGIPADQRHRLFGAFERMEVDAAGAQEGAGLGLSLSAQLARLMGGRLGHADNPGGGSVFWLELPCAAQGAGRPAQPAPLQPKALAPFGAGRMPLLVVDDMPMNRDIAAAFIRSAGYEAECVEGGAEAVAAVAAADFSTVLMDVRMPGMDGLEATRRIRALAGPRSFVPIVALTAQVFTEQINACREAGMDTHLAKPFTRASLLDAIERSVIAAGPRGRPEARSDEVAPIAAALGADLPIVNLDTLDQTASLLTPVAVLGYLRTLVERADALRHGLRARDGVAPDLDELAEAAHALAGGAGMFGFERLVFVATYFQHAVQTDPPRAVAAMGDLGATLDASLVEMRQRATAELV